jgi:hypothetical protein
MESEPLTGLEGRVWIDPGNRRLVHLGAHVSHAVNIGWGMIAHLYPGGTVTLEQTKAGDQRWIVEHVDEQLTVRALMVKNVKQRLVFDTANFQHVAPMGYQETIKILLDTPPPGPLTTHKHLTIVLGANSVPRALQSRLIQGSVSSFYVGEFQDFHCRSGLERGRLGLCAERSFDSGICG